MTTTIKLDAKAMETLFPDGTEARVNLQQAVIQEFANRNFRIPDSKELIERADRQAAALSKEWVGISQVALERHFGVSGSYQRNSHEAMQKFVQDEMKPRMIRILDNQAQETVAEHLASEKFIKWAEDLVNRLAEKRFNELMQDLAQKQADGIDLVMRQQFYSYIQSILDKAQGQETLEQTSN
jgi:hypothetical protein